MDQFGYSLSFHQFNEQAILTSLPVVEHVLSTKQEAGTYMICTF